MSIYYCPWRHAEATKKTELTQFPDTALIFYLVILWSPFCQPPTLKNVGLTAPSQQIQMCYLRKI